MGISIKKKIGWVLDKKLITSELETILEKLSLVEGKEFLKGVKTQVKNGETPKHELIGLEEQLSKVSGQDFFYEFDKGIVFCLPARINSDWSQDDSIIDAYLSSEAEATKTKITKIHGSIYPYSWRDWYVLGTNKVLSLDQIQELKFDEKKFQKLKTECGFKNTTLVKACGMLPPPLILEVLKKAQIDLSKVYPAIVSFST